MKVLFHALVGLSVLATELVALAVVIPLILVLLPMASLNVSMTAWIYRHTVKPIHAWIRELRADYFRE